MTDHADFINQIQAVLAEIKPALQQDGGDLEFVNVEDGVVHIKFKGACIGCPFSFYTLTMGIEKNLKERIPAIKKVVVD